MARAPTTSDVFNAIAEPRRRAILLLLLARERSVGEVADAIEVGQPSASKHLAVLKSVGLVRARRVGRRTLYKTEPRAMKPVHDWASRFERYWSDQLADIKRIAESARPADEAQTTESESTREEP